MSIYYVKLKSQHLSFICIIKQIGDDIYETPHGARYHLIEEEGKQYLSGNSLLEIVSMEKLKGVVILDPSNQLIE